MGRNNAIRSYVLVIVMAFFLSACARFEAPERGVGDVLIPQEFSLYKSGELGPDMWWKGFNSEELDRLVDEALAGNLTVAQAAARIRQASAVLQQTSALRSPSLNYGADASLSRRRTEIGGGESAVEASTRRLTALGSLLDAASSGGGTLLSTSQSLQQGRNAVESLIAGSPSTSTTIDTDSYGIGLTAGYEVDLWGRLKAGETSALADLEATREDAHAVLMSITGQVAMTWLDLQEVSKTLEVVKGQLSTNETNLGLMELRYRNGIASTLDVYQQQQAIAETEAVIPLLEGRYEVLRHTLAILMGKVPRADLGLAETDFAKPGPLPDYGLPADLLAHRPDIRAAGLRLRSADWEVSAAKADRLPRLSLSAGLSTNAESLNLLFDNWLAQLAASVTGPIFDGGRRKAEVERTQAVVDERLAAYRLIVLNAVGEVEDALVLMDRQEAYIRALDSQLKAAQDSLRESGGRYRQGLTDYLPVLTALRNVQSLERDVVEARHDFLIYRVQLHLALGGTWMAHELDDSKEGI